LLLVAVTRAGDLLWKSVDVSPDETFKITHVASIGARQIAVHFEMSQQAHLRSPSSINFESADRHSIVIIDLGCDI
jgi:hypothetical protein